MKSEFIKFVRPSGEQALSTSKTDAESNVKRPKRKPARGSDANPSKPEAQPQSLRPPAVFPDPATCCVRDAGLGGYFDCLGTWACQCPHSLNFGFGHHFCLHPKAAEMLARSQAQTGAAAREQPPDAASGPKSKPIKSTPRSRTTATAAATNRSR